jgi:hypothetical protein
LAAAYLGLLQKLGYKRVTKIEWVGQRKLSKFLSIQPFIESWMAYAFGRIAFGFLISGFDHAHRFIGTLIPVLSSMGLGQSRNLLLPTTEQTIFFRTCKNTQKRAPMEIVFPMDLNLGSNLMALQETEKDPSVFPMDILTRTMRSSVN